MSAYSEQTKDWEKYSKGKSYNSSVKPNYYNTVDTNIDFFNGNQWNNVQSNGMPTPVFNIIKRVITFFVASIMSSKTKLQFEPLAYSETEDKQPMDNEMKINKEASEMANAETGNLFEKFGMDNRFRDALFKAGIFGDVAAHIWWDKNKTPYGGGGQFKDIEGEMDFELVNGTNVYLGNANNSTISTRIQPYVLLSGREPVEQLKAEAKLWMKEKKNKSKATEGDINTISEDTDNSDQAGDMGKIEITGDDYGKATYILIYKYDKDTKTIKVSKCTDKVYMYEDVDTELNYYPVAWLNWEKQENQYHGRAISTGIIPNQIFINKMFAMVMYHLMNSAFPKVVYDADKLSAWSNEIAGSIGLKGLNPGDSVRDLAYYMEPGNMSTQIVQCIELAMSMTKEMLGLTDAWSGQSNPDNYKAIAVTVQQSSVPLENPKANFYEWVEDIGRIMLDMMGTYYGERPIVIKKDGQSQIIKYDFSQFKNLWLNVKADVGASSYWSEIASVGTLDNLLKQGSIDILMYLESLPEGYISHKQDLIEKVTKKLGLEQQMGDMKKQIEMLTQQLSQKGQEQQAQVQDQDKQTQYEKMAQFMEALPQDVQEKLKALPPDVMEKQILQMMQQSVGQSMKAGM